MQITMSEQRGSKQINILRAIMDNSEKNLSKTELANIAKCTRQNVQYFIKKLEEENRSLQSTIAEKDKRIEELEGGLKIISNYLLAWEDDKDWMSLREVAQRLLKPEEGKK